MNEQTTLALSRMASELGTTNENVWNVMMNQATISAITCLIFVIFVIVSGITLFRVHMKLSKQVNSEFNYPNGYDVGPDGLEAVMAIAAIVWIVLLIMSVLMIGNIISGFFNPEFWVLQHLNGNCIL